MQYKRPLYLTSPQMHGTDVREVQKRLKEFGYNPGTIDGYFGPSTKGAVKSFQSNQGLSVDGSVGPTTWNKLFNFVSSSGDDYLGPFYLTSPQMHGNGIKRVQGTLNVLGFNAGSIDGYFGLSTKNSVERFQRRYGLTVDGSVGLATWSKMTNLVPNITSALNELMLINEYMYRDIKPENTIVKLAIFYELVKNGSENDLKNQGWNNPAFYYEGEVIRYDAPGNISYGYLGKHFGFSNELLQRAAGLAQVRAGTSDPSFGTPTGNFPYGDDPVDQRYIILGIKKYNSVHR